MPRQAGLVHLRGPVVEGVELAHEIAALASPRREQRMRVDMHRLQPHAGEVFGAQRSAPGSLAQQFASFDDVGPVIAAGIGQRDQHLRMP